MVIRVYASTTLEGNANTYVGPAGTIIVDADSQISVADEQGTPGGIPISANTGNITFADTTIATANHSNITVEAGSQSWVFETAGTLLVPTPHSSLMTLTLGSDNYVPTLGKPTLTLTGDPWFFQGEFQYNANGVSELQLNNPFPELENPGYDSGDSFGFDQTVTGIPGYTLTLQLQDVTHPGPAGWTANVNASEPPAYPSTLQANGAQKFTSGTASWTMGIFGNFNLPYNVAGAVTAISLNPGPAVGYTTATNVPTVADSGVGSGLTVDLVADGFSISSVTVNQPGQNYAPGDQILINQESSTGTGELTIVGVRNINSTIEWLGLANLSVNSDQAMVLDVGSQPWKFDNDGNLTLPVGGTINYSNGSNALVGGGGVTDLIANGSANLTISSDGTLVLSHPDEPIYHPLDTQLVIEKAAGNYHIISGAYGLSLQATPVPGGYGDLNNNNYVDIFHDGISINVNDNTWGFDLSGNLTLPASGTINFSDGSNALVGGGGAANLGNFSFSGDSMLMPLQARLNSGGVGNTNSAEFGTVVNTYGDNGVVQNSQIYMSAGTGEARILVNMAGDTLVYYGTEEVSNPNFTGMVAMDPNVRSQYAIALDSNSNIILGGAQPGGTLISSDYIAGLGSLNSDYNLNGVYVDTMRTVVSGINNVQIQTGGGNVWTFGTHGVLAFPAGGDIVDSVGTSILDRISVTGSSAVLTKDQYNTSRLTFTGNANIETAGYLSGSGGLALVNSSGQQYVIVKSDRVQINTGFPDQGTGLQSYNEWQFLKSGVFKLPTTGIIENSGNQWTFGFDGNIVLPGTASILSDNVMTLQSGDTLFLRSDAGGVGIYSGNSQLSTTSDLGIEAYADSINLTPNAEGAVLIDINNTNAFVEISGPVGSWMFTGDGNLTLPAGGTINYSDGSNALVGGTTSPPNYASLAQSVVVTPPTFGNGGGGQLRVDVNAVVVSSNVNISNVGFMITALGTGSSGVGLLAEGTPATGVQTIQINGISGVNQTYYVSAFVTSQLGTTWSEVYLATSGICLIAGTMITLADGTKKAIENITYSDTLLAWDFDQGKFTTAKPLWIKQGETGGAHNRLTFSDGTVLRTFDQHRIFNKQWGAFTYPMTDNTPLGTLTFNEHGDEVMLVNKEQVFGRVEYYNVITDRHINLFSDSILTSCRLNNAYPIVDMQFNKAGRTLRDPSEFAGIDARWIAGLRLSEQTYSADDMRWYVARLERLDIAQLDSDQSAAA